jgi:hypothetical protein
MPTVDDFRLAWQDVANGSALLEKNWNAEFVEVETDGILTIATLVPVPVPNEEAEEAASRSLSAMRSGGFRPAPHVAHLLVASASPEALPVDRLVRHTRVVAALAKATHAIGVYDGNAGATHEPSFYLDIVGEPDLPLMLWNGLSIVKTEHSIEILTLGMAQLQLPDLLLVAPAEQGDVALPFAFDLLGYLISRGGPIPEGETVGRTAREKLPVVYVPSPVDPETRVMKVQLPRRKKRWWSFN